MASKCIYIFLSLCLLSTVVQAQPNDENEENDETVQQEAPQEEVQEQSTDQGREFEAFDPSEEISTDNAVSFPRDI